MRGRLEGVSCVCGRTSSFPAGERNGEAVAVYVLGFALLAALKKVDLSKLTK